jgi:hypothetical protein
MKHDVVINLQGDMPFVARASLRLRGLLAQEPPATSQRRWLRSVGRRSRQSGCRQGGAGDAAGRAAGRALYFTRSTLYGERRSGGTSDLWLTARRPPEVHRRPPSPLEQREKLEQLRPWNSTSRSGHGRRRRADPVDSRDWSAPRMRELGIRAHMTRPRPADALPLKAVPATHRLPGRAGRQQP